MKRASSSGSGVADDVGAFWGLYTVVKVGLIRLYFRMLLYVYYREVDVVGIENVPMSGPVIFCGNHQNQFVDGVMLYAHCPRIPSFIIAAKSMGRRIIGDFARFMQCIPVRRPQDEAVPGAGVITSITSTQVVGMHTKFTSLPEGVLISISLQEGKSLTVKLMKIHSDTEADIKEISDAPPCPEGRSYKVLPKINQSEMWSSVYTKLKQGGCLGIFPEGGSHDQTAMLGMKDGIARFALGSIEDGCDVPPVIIPVGLTYYYGHRFRSRAHIEFGKPLFITDDLYSEYLENKPKGIASLMKELQQSMAEVTIQCPDWRTLKQVHHVRRLYQPGRIKLDVAEYLRTTRRFAQGLRLVQDIPETKALVEKLEFYQTMLKNYLLTDHQVQSLDSLQSSSSTNKLVLNRMFMTAFWFVLCISGVVINLPVGVLSRVYSDIKSVEAVQNSSVKVMGNDVKASYKVICAMIAAPLYIMMYVFLAWWYYSFGLAVLILVFYPVWSYWSVVWANNCMCAARATFPLLLSQHSEKYMERFMQLHKLRKELTRDVRHLVDVHVRNKHELWSSRSEELYRKIEALDSVPATLDTMNTPFTVEHTSRAKPERVMSSSSSAKSE